MNAYENHVNNAQQDDKGTKTVLIWMAIILVIFMAASFFLGMLTMYHCIESVDYGIELEQDSIRVISDDADSTIHFDELEEYIIRDNI